MRRRAHYSVTTSALAQLAALNERSVGVDQYTRVIRCCYCCCVCRCELHATPQYGYGTLSHGRGPEPKGKLAQEGANPPRGTHTLCCCHAERAHMCQTQAHGEGQALHGIAPGLAAGLQGPRCGEAFTLFTLARGP